MEKYVTRDTTIGEVVQRWPKSAFIMFEYGLHCVGCHVSAFETIEEGCKGHGMPEEVIDELVEELNKFIAEEGNQEEKRKE